jgi:hypothetical protein
MPRNKKKKNFLSASRMKTLETCSWLYWVKYHLRVPDITNEGALRGTICHNVFELLLKPRHKKYFLSVMGDRGIKSTPAVNRMVVKFLKKHEVFTEENYDLCSNMIFVGLNNDFFGKDDLIYGKEAHIETPEYAFEIESKSPKYNIRGYMDKPIEYKKSKIVRIVDYKSSKQKFKGEELHSNIQAMVYSLAALKIWPKLKPRIEFLFLKFPKQPVQALEFTKDELKGFEFHLEQVQKVIDNFNEDSARTNFAIDGGWATKWMCGPTKSGWECPYKNKLTYYALKDKSGGIIKTSFDNDFSPSKEEIVEKIEYQGCPKFQKKKDRFSLK